MVCKSSSLQRTLNEADPCQATFIVHLLSLMSFVNAIYTFYRKRHYRLFEAPVDAPPSTPSARRVRVDSSPVSSSPLRFLSGVMGSNSAQARAHPNSKTDVWEISVWDPTPLCLKLFCLFSPGHVLMYWFFLPTLPEDPRPSTTVVTALSLAILLSVQLLLLQQSFSQQSKDSSLIHKEVFNEYDIKYVHPHTHPLMRDVGTQVSSSGGKLGRSPARSDGVDTYMPVTIVNKGFQTNPNPNYLGHVDPDAYKAQETPNRAPSRNPAASSAQTPSFYTPLPTRDFPSPLQQRTAFRKPQPQQRASVGPGTGDGGSLGVYSHAHSPLKKAASQNFAAQRGGQRRQEKTRLSDWM